MATILAPQFGREVLRCNRCDLVQFATPKMFCRRCRHPYDWECAIEAEQTENIHQPESILQTDSLRDRIAYNVLKLRQLNGFTQRDVGLRMGVPRTYVSKIEGRKVHPQSVFSRPSGEGAWYQCRRARQYAARSRGRISVRNPPRSVSWSNITFRKQAHPRAAKASS